VSKDQPVQTVDVLAFSPGAAARHFTYHATFVPRNGASDPVEVPADPADTIDHLGALILDALV
jgi:hypothetical protein